MSFSSDSKASVVLQAAEAGDRQAAADLLPLVYAKLQQLARLARQAPGQTRTYGPTRPVARRLFALTTEETFQQRVEFRPTGAGGYDVARLVHFILAGSVPPASQPSPQASPRCPGKSRDGDP